MTKPLPPKDHDDNPEWTDADFARARPAGEIMPPPVMALLVRQPGRPVGTVKAVTKRAVSLRLDPDVVDYFRAGGPGWQSRINEVLRKAIAP